MTRDFRKEISLLEEQIKSVLTDQAKVRGNRKFKCVCGSLHTISKCDAFTFPRWESGSGYEDGRWWEGCVYILCPVNGKYNRCYFNPPPYSHYNDYAYNAEMQFKSIYKPLFKSFTRLPDNSSLPHSKWENNCYFDQNHKKFELKVKS